MKSLYVTIVTAFLALWGATPSPGLRILGIFPGNDKSHFVMCEQLMKGLVRRGHQVDVYSHFPLKNPLKNYTDHVLENSLPSLDNLSYESINETATSIKFFFEFGKLGLPICNLLKLPTFRKLVKNPPKDPPYDLVVVEPFISNCYLAWGRHLKVPLIAVSTSNLLDWVHEPLRNPFNPAVHPGYFSSFIAPMNFPQRLENIIVSMLTAISFNYLVAEQDRLVRDVFGPGYPGAQELYKEVSLMLVNYNQELNGIRPFVPSVVPVGGLHILDDYDPLTWEVQQFLDGSKHGFVFMSFGTLVKIETFPKSTLDAFYTVFNKIAPIRVLVKIASHKNLPSGLPTNVMTHNHLPEIKVLKHKNIRAFITHGGLLSTQEAIYFGVPMIGIPLFADQYFNVRSYERKNVAVKLDVHDITEETFSKAMIKIIGSPLYKKEAEKMSKLLRDLPQSPMDTAIYWIEFIHRHGENVLRPSELNMAWWQIASLDVFATLSIIIVTFGVTAISVFWMLIYLCRKSKTLLMKLKRD